MLKSRRETTAQTPSTCCFWLGAAAGTRKHRAFLGRQAGHLYCSLLCYRVWEHLVPVRPSRSGKGNCYKCPTTLTCASQASCRYCYSPVVIKQMQGAVLRKNTLRKRRKRRNRHKFSKTIHSTNTQDPSEFVLCLPPIWQAQQTRCWGPPLGQSLVFSPQLMLQMMI